MASSNSKRLLKKILKISGIGFGVLILIGVGLFVHVWYFKPFNINLFFGRTALQFALDSPEMLSSLRVLERFGIDGHNAKLNDASTAFMDRIFARLHETHKTLITYEDEDLSKEDRRSKQVALYLLDLILEAEPFRFHNHPVNQMFGVQNGFPSFMDSIHQVNSTDDAEDYLARLTQIGRKFDQVIEGLKHREKKGILPPQFLVDKVLEEMRNFVGTPSDHGILYTSFIKKMTEAKFSEFDHGRFASEAKTHIETSVYPAYRRLIAYFEELDLKVSGNFGVWNMPNGEAYYRLALKFFTTTDYTPDYIHHFGLKEVERLQGEIIEILTQQGWDTSTGFTAALKAFSEDQRFYYEDTEQGREAILRDYQTIIDEISKGMPSVFNVMPQASVGVKRVPQFKEKTAPGGYYQAPAMDGSRPGAFYANLFDIKATPRYGMRTLAYHEAVPGHHFQLTIQRELKNLPFFRRLIPFTAYAEGWAMYAERLAGELGYTKDPYDNIGRLQSELFRAVRLVVDTGIHAKRWSREQAIEYMLLNTGIAESDVVSEIERYFILPGQACSYKVGMTKFLELRELAKKELGEKFDLRDFHDVVLLNAALPLTMLETLVRDYIAQQKKS